jgi:hypothetical protein
MKARVTLTPDLFKRLTGGKTLRFKFPKPVAEVEITIEEDISDKFERVFGKVWNKMLDKLDKLAE